MNLEPALDVVIVNYNSGPILLRCLEHIAAEPGSKLNICVVDNNSSDESMALIDSLSSNISTINNNSNTGFASACNQGAHSGRSPHIAFINPDCFISGQQLSQLSSQLARHEAAALIGCRVVNEDGSLQAATRRHLPTFWRIFFQLSGLSRWSFFKGININDSGNFKQVQSVEAVNGACMMVKRQAFEALAGFDEAYPLHFEDLDLFARMKARDLSVIYDSKVMVTHLQGQSSQDSQQVNSWKKQGLLRYLSKHRPSWEHRIARFCLRLK